MDIIDLLPIETATQFSETTPAPAATPSCPTSALSETGSSASRKDEDTSEASLCRSLSKAHELSRDAPNVLLEDCQSGLVLEQVPPVSTIPSSASLEGSCERIRWHIHWKQPALMICSGLFGVLLALGHHTYYSKLHGTLASTAEKQQWPIRIGTVFSILTITFFSVAISEAYTEYTWTVVRSRNTSFGLDALFSATRNSFAFANMEFSSVNAWLSLVTLTFCQAREVPRCWDYEGLASEYRYNSGPLPNGFDSVAWTPPPDFPPEQPLQIWVETSSEIVCTLMNASSEVTFQFRNGVQVSTVNSVTSYNPVFLPTHIPEDCCMPNPNLVNVTTYTYENEYFYSPEHLLQSYGIALVFTTMAIVLGLLSLRSNGASHSISFSAIMSITRNLQLDELVLREGQDIGSEPLTEAMMKAREVWKAA
ncbi:uncharacterized protein PAC_12826 [Phialocephala subalpina]|uniref:Uncharacterized protein n=1 Tax=Phialocephala subalpina TaxID=576137 RepID=A0A1L7XD13_9HELO|nr:uncharacterized protein PAC_12826 [Phialocephala subalpina]